MSTIRVKRPVIIHQIDFFSTQYFPLDTLATEQFQNSHVLLLMNYLVEDAVQGQNPNQFCNLLFPKYLLIYILTLFKVVHMSFFVFL